jgi:K+-transporting ATPase KdpF subunit
MAGARRIAARRRRVNVVYVVSGALAFGLFLYLLYAMFRPEKF